MAELNLGRQVVRIQLQRLALMRRALRKTIRPRQAAPDRVIHRRVFLPALQRLRARLRPSSSHPHETDAPPPPAATTPADAARQNPAPAAPPPPPPQISRRRSTTPPAADAPPCGWGSAPAPSQILHRLSRSLVPNAFASPKRSSAVSPCAFKPARNTSAARFASSLSSARCPSAR
jgi:hypothetical protein